MSATSIFSPDLGPLFPTSVHTQASVLSSALQEVFGRNMPRAFIDPEGVHRTMNASAVCLHSQSPDARQTLLMYEVHYLHSKKLMELASMEHTDPDLTQMKQHALKAGCHPKPTSCITGGSSLGDSKSNYWQLHSLSAPDNPR